MTAAHTLEEAATPTEAPIETTLNRPASAYLPGFLVETPRLATVTRVDVEGGRSRRQVEKTAHQGELLTITRVVSKRIGTICRTGGVTGNNVKLLEVTNNAGDVLLVDPNDVVAYKTSKFGKLIYN